MPVKTAIQNFPDYGRAFVGNKAQFTFRKNVGFSSGTKIR